MPYSVKGIVHYHHGRKHAGRHDAGEVTQSSTSRSCRQQGERDIGPGWAFITPKHTPSDAFSTTRLHVLMLLPKHSNI